MWVRMVAAGVWVGVGRAGLGYTSREEWEAWYANHASKVEWVGYSGSSTEVHHFTVRLKNEDVKLFEVGRRELVVEDERPWSSYWTGRRVCYLVDPAQGYRLVEGP